MPQAILLTGTILASSIGCALVMLVLGGAIKSAWKRPASDSISSLEFDDAGVFEFDHDNAAVRGYDSPELCREDCAARLSASGCDRNLH
jgi:hypothetical protein